MPPTGPAEAPAPGPAPGSPAPASPTPPGPPAGLWLLVPPVLSLALAAGLAAAGTPGPRLWRALDGFFFVTGSLVFLVGALFAKPEPFGDGAGARPRIGCAGEAAPPALAEADDEAAALGALRGRLRAHAGRLMLGGLGLLAWTLVLDRLRRALG